MSYVTLYFGISLVVSIVLFILMVKYDVSIIEELFTDDSAVESKLLESLFLGLLWPLGVVWIMLIVIVFTIAGFGAVFEFIDSKLGTLEQKLFNTSKEE